MPLPVVLVLLLAGLPLPASAGIGGGSTLTVSSQTQMLLQQGGGYVDWEISGPVAVEVRRNVDQNLGDGDGNITPAEAQSYANEIDLVLENYIFYGSARIVRSALLNKDIETDTAGLIGPVNSSRAIEIHFTFSANLRSESGTVNFGDLRIPTAPFRALRGDPNQTFEGELRWRHTEIAVGMASFSAVDADRGRFSRFRGPGIEVLWYDLEGRNLTSTDQARFDTFSVVQCPLELFVVLCVFAVVAVWFPRHFMRSGKRLKVRWLHLLVILLVVVALALFLAGADGAVVWTVSPLLAVLSYVLSWGIYSAGWKGIARSSVPEVPARASPEPARRERGVEEGAVGAGEPPVSRVISARQWADYLPVVEGTPVGSGPGRPAPEESGASPGALAGPPRHPAPGNRRDLRCPRCKATFAVDDPGTRPLPIKCTMCGAEGVLRK